MMMMMEEERSPLRERLFLFLFFHYFKLFLKFISQSFWLKNSKKFRKIRNILKNNFNNFNHINYEFINIFV